GKRRCEQVAVEVWRKQTAYEFTFEHSLLLVGAAAERVKHRGRGDPRSDPQALQSVRVAAKSSVDLLDSCVGADQVSLEDAGESLPVTDLRKECASHLLVREQCVPGTDQRKLLDVAVPQRVNHRREELKRSPRALVARQSRPTLMHKVEQLRVEGVT